MPTDEKPTPPNPFDDVRKGLGLLFRAARTVVQKLPTDPIEKVVLDGAREVGRAVENVTNTVTSTIEKQVFGKDKGKHPDRNERDAKADAGESAPPSESKPGATTDDTKHDGPKPRVG